MPGDYKADKSPDWAEDLGYFATLICVVVVLSIVSWLAFVLYAPHRRLDTGRPAWSVAPKAVLEKARMAVAGALKKRLVQTRNLGERSRTNLSISDAELDEALDDILKPQTNTPGRIIILQDTIKAIPPGERVTVYDEQGAPRSIPRSDVEAALATGYRLTKLQERKAETYAEPHAADSVDARVVLRIEPRGGNNLVLYLRKSNFEIVPFPDRGEFVKAIGKAWCENTGEDSHFFLPSVYIRDIRTGEELASYSCVFESVSW